MFCIKCGKQNVDEAVYCSFCGTKLSGKEAENITNQITEQDNTEPVEAEYTLEDDSKAATETPNDHSDEKDIGGTENNYREYSSNNTTDLNNKSKVSIEADPVRKYLIVANILILLITIIISRVAFVVLFMVEIFAYIIYKSLDSMGLVSSNLTIEFRKAIVKIKGNRIYVYSGTGILIFLTVFTLFFSSDYYEMMRFESTIDSLIEAENDQELNSQIEKLLPANLTTKLSENDVKDIKSDKLSYIVESILKSNSLSLKALLEDSYDNFYPQTQEKVLSYYKVHNLRFSTVPELLAKLHSKLEYSHTEKINNIVGKLKTHPNSEIIREFEKGIMQDVNTADGNSNFLSIKEKINFLRTTFGTSNDSVFYKLEEIFYNLNELKEKLESEEVPEPSKPAYYKPEYDGAFYMYGEYVGPFNGGGVVIRANGKYYLVENGIESRNPFARYYYGYYEKANVEPILLNRGRNGTECEVLKVTSEETYRDDQNDYQDKVKEAQEDYSREMKEYQEGLVKFRNYISYRQEITQRINEMLFKAKKLII